MQRISRRGLVTGAAALAAYASLPRDARADMLNHVGLSSSVVAGVNPATFDPASLASSGAAMTLSNGNLTATKMGNNFIIENARSTGYIPPTVSAPNDLIMWQITGACTTGEFIPGLCTAAMTLGGDGSQHQMGANDTNLSLGWLFASDGRVFINNVSQLPSAPIGNGTATAEVVLRRSTNKVWVRVAAGSGVTVGTFYNNISGHGPGFGTAGADVGGISLPSPMSTSNLYAATGFYGNSVAQAATINLGGSAFASVPALVTAAGVVSFNQACQGT